MNIINLYPGGHASNSYLVCKGKYAVLIDCTASPEVIEAELARQGATLHAVLLTHGHYDHLITADAVRRHFGVPVLLHEGDADFPTTGRLNCYHVFFGYEATFPPADRHFRDGDVLRFGTLEITVTNTPGHTPGSSVLRAGDALFTGDTLMSCGYGRTTFPGGNTLAMRDSLQKLFSFPSHLTIYPGHGEDENLGVALRNIFG